MITASKFAIICAAAALAATPAVAGNDAMTNAVIVLVSQRHCGTGINKAVLSKLIMGAAEADGTTIYDMADRIVETAEVVSQRLVENDAVGSFCWRISASMRAQQ